MNKSIRISGMFVAAILSVAAFGAAPARADDDQNAMQQLQDVEHSSQDATQAQTEEDAKDLSNQGFDTPNEDPAPPPVDASGSGN